MALDELDLQSGGEVIRPYTSQGTILSWVWGLVSLAEIVGFVFVLARTDVRDDAVLRSSVIAWLLLTIFQAFFLVVLGGSILVVLRWRNAGVVMGRSALIYINCRRRRRPIPWETVTSLRLREVPTQVGTFHYLFVDYLDATGRSCKLGLGRKEEMRRDSYEKIVATVIDRAGLSRSSTRKMRFRRSETVHERA